MFKLRIVTWNRNDTTVMCVCKIAKGGGGGAGGN